MSTNLQSKRASLPEPEAQLDAKAVAADQQDVQSTMTAPHTEEQAAKVDEAQPTVVEAPVEATPVVEAEKVEEKVKPVAEAEVEKTEEKPMVEEAATFAAEVVAEVLKADATALEVSADAVPVVEETNTESKKRMIEEIAKVDDETVDAAAVEDKPVEATESKRLKTDEASPVQPVEDPSKEEVQDVLNAIETLNTEAAKLPEAPSVMKDIPSSKMVQEAMTPAAEEGAKVSSTTELEKAYITEVANPEPAATTSNVDDSKPSAEAK